MTDVVSREQRCALLAEAEREELIALADACLEDGTGVRVLVAPEVGCVTAQVREPVLAERFLLGDVLACRAEVELAGHRGWAMRLGDDRAAVLAAAVLDAEVQSGRPRAAEIDRLCERVAHRRAEREGQEWAELAPTVVEFEELT
ncbi:phosphonate C-P lyase system protein PhnG [Streptomyces sp. NPDC005917]|uniref:phosphonate C-P lyase system protein PhnG n=1 Tax=unclassified Streptomyces TaxID=2593676 RepID=UPI0033C13BC0